MIDEKKFYEITKPIKFRSFKLLKQSAVLWCEGVRELIKYRINYILYKLKILKRYSYRDDVAGTLTLPPKFYLEPELIETEYFSAVARMRYEKERHIDRDYFYMPLSEGGRKITYIVKDEETSNVFMTTHLEDIHIKVGDKWFCADNLPVFKTATLKSVGEGDSDSPIEYETVTYDVSILKKLFIKELLIENGELNYVHGTILNFVFENCVNELRSHLEKITLKDLMI